MFDELTGNSRVKTALKRILVNDRLPGAMLFTGEEGIGGCNYPFIDYCFVRSSGHRVTQHCQTNKGSRHKESAGRIGTKYRMAFCEGVFRNYGAG